MGEPLEKPVGLALPMLLIGSAVVRLLLVVRGGQYYFPDEMRFDRSVHLLSLLRSWDLWGIRELLLSSPDHTGFVVLGLPAALLRGVLPGPPKGNAWAAAAFLSLASVASIGLVYRLAGRLGASREEALRASALLACCTTLVIYSRHLVPYDCALALGLLALDLGLSARAWGAFASGLVASAAFLTYNGYWMLALLALVLPAARERTIPALRRLAIAGAAFALPPAILEAASLGRDERYLAGMEHFSHTIVQSDMSEGGSLPFAYLWHAEHWLLAVLLLGLLLAAGDALRRRLPERGWLWGGSAIALYLGQVLLSVGFGRLAVYGRLVRQEIPFLCLAAAVTLTALSRGWVARALWALLLGQTAVNLAAPWAQAFPLEVRNHVLAEYGEVSLATTIVGPAQVPKARRYTLLNARYLSPVLGVRPDPPGEAVFSTRHPLQYLPYQYEGFLPLERGILRSADISIRLIRGPKEADGGG